MAPKSANSNDYERQRRVPRPDVDVVALVLLQSRHSIPSNEPQRHSRNAVTKHCILGHQ